MQNHTPTTPTPDKAYVRAKIIIEQLRADNLYICCRCGIEGAEPPNSKGDCLCFDCIEAIAKAAQPGGKVEQ